MPLQFARRAISLRSWSSREVWKRCRKPLQRYTEGAEPLALALDLREPASAELAVKQTLDRYGRIDALINVAGAVLQTDLFAMIDAEWRIASLEMLPDTEPLPHLICSRLIFGSGGGDEAGHHGDAR